MQDRHHPVAELPLRRRHVDLQAVAEAEQQLGPVAVGDQVVEGRQQRGARARKAARQGVEQRDVLSVDDPVTGQRPVRSGNLAAHQPARRDQLVTRPLRHGPRHAAERSGSGGVRGRRRLGHGAPRADGLLDPLRHGPLERNRRAEVVRYHALRQVPPPLAAATAGDHHLAPARKQLQHPANAPLVAPAGGAPGARGEVLEVAGGEGPTPLQLAQHVAPECVVVGQPLPDVARPLAVAERGALGRGRVDGVVGHRQDVGVVLEQRALLPEQPLQVGRVVGAEPRPPDEQLAACYRVGGIDLDAPQPLGDRHDPGAVRRQPLPGEQLGGDAEASNLIDGQPQLRGSSPAAATHGGV